MSAHTPSITAELKNGPFPIEARTGALYRQIQALAKQFERMALGKAPAPAKPRVNTAFNSRN
jgi:hypothetical protein